MPIDFQPDLDFEPDDSQPAKGPNDWSEQYKKYTADVKQRRQRTPIPGSEEYDSTPAMSYEDFVKSKEQKQRDKYLGLGEAGLSLLTGLPATFLGGLAGLTAPINPMAHTRDPQQMFKDVSETLTYSPKTVEGLRFAEQAGSAMQAFPPYGSYVSTAVPRVPKAPKAPKVDPVLETLRKTKETPTIDFQPESAIPDTSNLRLESPIAADIRVNQQNRRLNTADDFNNRDANVRAVEEEIAAKEAADAHEAALAEQARLAEVDHWRNNAKQDAIVEDFGNNDPLSRMPEMRIDENGIPIRADLSMEAANLENPLQRNLWGDELPHSTGDGGVPLTQAIDNMPWAQRRGAIKRELMHDIESSPELQNAIKAANKELGAFDIEAVTEGIAALRVALGKTNQILKDKEGNGVIVFRGTNTPGKHNPAEPRPGQAVFVSDNPYLSSNYVRDPYEWHMGKKDHGGAGAVYPMVFRPDVQIIEFPVDRRGFDIVGFHERATRLGKNQVLVARNSRDAGPGSWKDPYNRASYENDQYAFTDSSVVDSLYNITKDVKTDPQKSTFKERAKAETEYNIAALKEGGIPDGQYQTFHLKNNGKTYLQQFTENGRQAELERLQNRLSNIENDISFSGLKRTQSGALDLKGIEDTARKIGDNLSKIGTKAINVLTPKEKLIPESVRGHDYIPKGHAPENIIADALAEGKDGPEMSQYLQSGLQLAGEKAGSALQIGVARWLSWAEKTATKDFRDKVKPLEQALTRLNRTEMNQAWNILKDEMFSRAQYGVDAIRNSGASDSVVRAYEGLRSNFDAALNTINEYRAKIGKEPITKQAAYLSSQWNGNYHVPLYDSKGRLVWYIKTTSASEARKALKWIGENHPDIDVSKSKPQYKPSELSPRIPKDITDVVSDMIKLFGEDSAIAKEMAAIVEEAKAAEAFNSRGFKVHFEEKANVRGFLGDRPWLSEHDNAVQGMKAQIQYLKDAYRWAPMQEALANVKQVLGNEELIAQQPNNIAMAKAYTANALGVTKNIFKPAENAAARMLGTSPTAFTKAIGDMKSITYLQLLGASTGYALATPLQAFILGPSRHMLISAEGIKHNPLATLFASISDGAKIVINHELSANFTGKSHDIGLTPFGKEAKRYMEENGIATINLFDEYSDLGEHKGVAAGKKLLGFTISVPEKIARSMTFMSFAHHLNDGGFKGSKAELFRRAEELTDDTLTKFTKSARPLAVDSMGMTGELAYTFQSPLFNYYNNLGLLAKSAKTNPLPLLMAAFAMPMLLGGTSAIPGINEADGAWNLIKGLLAKYSPSAYNKVKDFGIREFQLEHLPDWATFGSVSEATGTQMASRFSTQALDVENPLGKIGPVPSAVGNWAQIPGMVTGSTGAAQGAWSNAPPMGKGILEGTIDRFKAGPERADGRQPMLNPGRLSENVNSNYARNKEDKIKRMFGLTSLDEARAKEVNYLNAQESKRAKTARDTAINKMWDGVMTKNDDKVQDNAKLFFELNGSDTEFESALSRKIENTYLTQQERDAIKANTLAKIMNLKRRLKMEK